MGHHISAVICKLPVDIDQAAKLDLPVFSQDGFAIIAMNCTHSDLWAEKLGVGHVAYSDMIFDRAITLKFASMLGIETFALIETDYFGGFGEQFATVYERDKRVFDVTSDGINQALRLVGVERAPGLDEFDTIGLGKHRDFSFYFSKYLD